MSVGVGFLFALLEVGTGLGFVDFEAVSKVYENRIRQPSIIVSHTHSAALAGGGSTSISSGDRLARFSACPLSVAGTSALRLEPASPLALVADSGSFSRMTVERIGGLGALALESIEHTCVSSKENPDLQPVVIVSPFQ